MNNTDKDISGLIIKGVGGAYTVSTPKGSYVCTARGVFRNRNITPLVGDRVTVTVTDAAEHIGTLREIHPRANELLRPRAANMDQVVITVAAAQPAFSAGLLDRYLLLAEHARIAVVICFNKAELCTPAVADMADPYERAGYPVLWASSVTGEGMAALLDRIQGKVTVFAGPSGVGKSSLINRLVPEADCETGTLSAKIERGRHTTRHTEFLPITPSGYIVDTPGFTSLELPAVPLEQLAALFREFAPFLGSCRFSNCLHDKEVGCTVKAQVGQAIHPQRYDSYLNILGRQRCAL